MPWSANDTVKFQLVLLRNARQTAVEYFKFQMAVAASKKIFGTFLITRDYLFKVGAEHILILEPN